MLRKSIILNGIKVFLKNPSGGTAVHVALLFGAIGMAIALLAAPSLQSMSNQYAANEHGIDTVVTGSLGKDKRYVIRRSILEPNKQKVCFADSNC